MHAGKRYSFITTVLWSKRSLLVFFIIDSIPTVLHCTYDFEWLHIPWQPISVIGIAVAFYLGFKNNSSYDRMWEARKIWGGIVNVSRSFTVMIRDFTINDQKNQDHLPEEELQEIRKTFVHRHIAWLRAMTIELRKPKEWEHHHNRGNQVRKKLGTEFSEEKFETLRPYLSEQEYDYMMSKDNKSSHLLSLQTKALMKYRSAGQIEHFRHLALQNLITECYTLQGKSERIKNFPFPRQYASVNYFFVVIFIILLPFGMLDAFSDMKSEEWIWLSVPFSVIVSWVFWMMEMIGDYSENPFEGLHNDVPITSMAIGIERDIRQMLDETDLPENMKPSKDLNILV